MPMQDSTAMVLEQLFVKSHELHVAEADRENAGWGNIAEQTRLLFLTRSQGNDLAQDILDQRSAGQQPQGAGGPQPVPVK
jgi:hypothetical protein